MKIVETFVIKSFYAETKLQNAEISHGTDDGEHRRFKKILKNVKQYHISLKILKKKPLLYLFHRYSYIRSTLSKQLAFGLLLAITSSVLYLSIWKL